MWRPRCLAESLRARGQKTSRSTWQSSQEPKRFTRIVRLSNKSSSTWLKTQFDTRAKEDESQSARCAKVTESHWPSQTPGAVYRQSIFQESSSASIVPTAAVRAKQ